MFDNLIQFPIESPLLEWEAKEVLRDRDGSPHLMLRVRMSGTHFPHRAGEPYLRVGEVRSVFARIEPDAMTVSGYFDRPLRGGAVEFGYDDDPPLLRSGRSFAPQAVDFLERDRLPDGVRNLKRFSSEL